MTSDVLVRLIMIGALSTNTAAVAGMRGSSFLSSSSFTSAISYSASTLASHCSYHVGVFHPVWTVAVRRASTHTTGSHQAITARQSAFWDRCRKNITRLYARRVLELAAASAASQRLVATLEEYPQLKPQDWENWKRKEWTEELLASLGHTKAQRVWKALMRLGSLALLAAPLTILVPLSYVSQTAQDWSWDYLLWGIEQAGPSFVKLTQWATTRPDLFSAEFCRFFAKLRDETRGHSFQETLRILEEDFGGIINCDQLLEFDTEPIGSGCVAQVYRGRLKQPCGQYPAGTEIAIKVQHPGIWDKVCVDFYIMGKAARFLENLPLLNLSYLSLVDTVEQFRDIMLPQLDLTLEARHLQRFNRDFANDEHVAFPHPLSELTTTRVLTETFVYGTPILHFTKENEAVRKELAMLGLTTTLRMIFKHDFLHGDLHPGNILVGKNEQTGRLRLLLLDCGLVVEMGPDQHVNLVKILGAFTRRKGRLAGQLMVDTSSKCQANELDMELFVSGIEQICIEDEDNNFVEKVGDYIADICFLACKHKVKLEASFINAALAVEIMEGIASALFPEIQVTQVALPMIVQAEMMHRLPKFSLW